MQPVIPLSSMKRGHAWVLMNGWKLGIYLAGIDVDNER
jgi:hypothetical protein